MDLKWLQDNGGFVPQTTVSKEVSWTHPGPEGEDVTDTFTVRVKKLSAGDIERLWSDYGKAGHPSYTAAMIAAAVRLGDEGDGALTYDQAFMLDPGLAEALLVDAVHSVNPVRRKGAAAKN